ncbi:MAG: acyl-CoA thioesterase, partial [Flavobacteriales bacterium]|nr:acyl-CoA thioesterase [Flavobacteriales bacterium]
RQEQAKNRTTAFRTSEFKMALYLDSLKGQNAKIELIND